MTKSANIFNKLHFLIILAIFSFSVSILAAKPEVTADSETLEDLLADPSAQTTPAVTHDAGKPASKNPTSISFFDRIKSFFTFKSKQQNIKTVEAEKPSSQTQEDLEPFIDLGSNKLKAVVVDDKDKVGLADALKQSQNIQDDAKSKAAASQITAPIKEAVSDVSQNQANVTLPPVPVTPTAQGQNSTNLKTTDSDVSLPALPLDSNNALGPNAFDKQNTSMPPAVPSTTAKIAVDGQKPAVNTDSVTTLNSASVPNQTSKNDIPELPDIPNNFGENPKDVAVDQSKDATSTQVKKTDVSSTNIKANDVKELSIKTSKAQNAKAPAFSNNADILSVPEMPAVPQDSFAAVEPGAVVEKILDTSDRAANLSDLSKFVIDEAKVLLLPNDDIVLGELTESAAFEQMDFQSYSKLYESQLKRANNYSKQLVIDNFLNSYDKNFNNSTIKFFKIT